MNDRQQFEIAIATLESQRSVIGDEVTDAALAPLRARLAAIVGREQSLRQVTVLFLDVVGSTALSRLLDPEDVHTIIDGALRRLTAIVRKNFGRVLQYAGDSILAVFGATEAREDDPERAVRCGLAIVREAKQIAGEVRAASGGGFDVRVGIHTGSVLLGGGIDAVSTIRGMAVNIAARMEQTAPAGGVRISYETQRHVRGKFDLTAEAPIAVKGFAEPMRSHLVVRATPRQFSSAGRGVDGVVTEMFGREAELTTLREAFDMAAEGHRLHLVTISGDPGLGKTRLIVEFERWLAHHHPKALRLHSRAEPYSNSVPYGLLRDLLAWHFGILDSDSQAQAYTKLAEGFASRFRERGLEHAALVGHLIGLDQGANPYVAGIESDGRQIRDRAFHAISQYLRLGHNEHGAPVVVLFDDLHWADDGSLDFINHVAQACNDVPMLLLCTARSALYERRPLWGGGRNNHQRIELGPLSRRASQDLAEALLTKLDTIPTALRDLVTSSAEGNPYFVEELIGMLIDDGVVVAEGGRWWVVADRLLQVRVPSTLAGVIQARLDALPTNELVMLQHASVIGHVFWDEALRRTAPGDPHLLRSLVNRGLTRERDTTSFEGTREYVFKNHLLHKVTYDSVLKRDKRQQHILAADWLLARSGDRVGECHGMIAEHYERAGEVAQALIYLRRAGESAAKAYVNDAALDYVKRALAIAPASDGETRFALILVQVKVHGRAGQRLQQVLAIDRLAKLAETLASDVRRAQALGLRAQYEAETGDEKAACASAAMAIELAEKAGSPEMALAARIELTNLSQSRGDHLDALIQAEKCLALARSSGNQSGESAALNQLAIAAARRGNTSLSRDFADQALKLARARGDRSIECVVLCNLGDTEREVGNFDVAMERLQTGLGVAREIGWRHLELHILCIMSAVALTTPDKRELSLSLAKQASAIDFEATDRRFAARALLVEGHAYASLDDAHAAALRYQQALSMLRESEDLESQPNALAELARAEIRIGLAHEAILHVHESLRIVDAAGPKGSIEELRWVYYSCYQVLLESDPVHAHELLRRAHDLLVQRANELTGVDRGNFLSMVPINRAIEEALARMESARQQ